VALEVREAPAAPEVQGALEVPEARAAPGAQA
jgi:hypothetical protein